MYKVGDTIYIDGNTNFCTGGEEVIQRIDDNIITTESGSMYDKDTGNALSAPFGYYISYIVNREPKLNQPIPKTGRILNGYGIKTRRERND